MTKNVFLLCFSFFSSFFIFTMFSLFLCFSPSVYQLIFASLSLIVFALYCMKMRLQNEIPAASQQMHKTKKKSSLSPRYTHTHTHTHTQTIGTISQMLSQSSCLAVKLDDGNVSKTCTHYHLNILANTGPLAVTVGIVGHIRAPFPLFAACLPCTSSHFK